MEPQIHKWNYDSVDAVSRKRDDLASAKNFNDSILAFFYNGPGYDMLRGLAKELHNALFLNYNVPRKCCGTLNPFDDPFDARVHDTVIVKKTKTTGSDKEADTTVRVKDIICRDLLSVMSRYRMEATAKIREEKGTSKKPKRKVGANTDEDMQPGPSTSVPRNKKAKGAGK